MLKCIGYFHDPHRNSFGLMYDFPTRTEDGTLPLTLKELIRGFGRPELGVLFRLASMLVHCICAFHKAGWLHKNLSAHNIVFFDPQLATSLPQRLRDFQVRGRNKIPSVAKTPELLPIASVEPAKSSSQPWLKVKRFVGRQKSKSKAEGQLSSSSKNNLAPEASYTPQIPEGAASMDSISSADPATVPVESEITLANPYIVGFDHTREDETTAFTTDASRNPRQQLYQHPDYLRKLPNQRFCSEYDWYSIGLVLLEIGLWQPAEDMAPKLTGKLARSHWLQYSTPQLRFVMGKTYQEVVEFCLASVMGKENRFEEFGVRRLDKCNA